MSQNIISATCNYPSSYVTVNQHQLHYIKSGEGVPIVFIHGVPTYSYLWRNIIPHLDNCSQCIAIDLLGFGLSDKPDIQYDLKTYQTYLAGMLDALNLDEMILVLHGWGSVVGLDYARSHTEKIKGLVLLESHIRAKTDLTEMSLPVQELLMLAKQSNKSMEDKILHDNFYIESILPASIMRKLTKDEMTEYRKPFLTPASRKAILDFMQLAPNAQESTQVQDCINQYTRWLEKTNIPKLMLYAIPGFVSTMSTVHWAKEHLQNLTLVDIGEALHIPQETQPAAIGQAMRQWFNKHYL